MEGVAQDSYFPVLNPCSLESLPLPVKIRESEKEIWPLIVSCYHLQEDGSRQGRMDLFCVENSDSDPSSLRFGMPRPVKMSPGGVLDGKWYPKRSEPLENGEWWFATAKSTGQVAIHSFKIGSNPSETGDPPLFVGEETYISDALECSSESTPLCLAINWDTSRRLSGEGDTTSLVASYSNGMAAIFDVAKCTETGRPQVSQRKSWLAHTLFGTMPAEVWSICFAANGKLVMTGGDDAKLKVWDTRSTHRPAQVFQHFDAGVTVLSPHPRNEHIVAAGSYDETVGLYDIRYPSQMLLSRSDPLGGGIWRIQWHPYHDDKMLIAAMHGGCRVVNLERCEESQPAIAVVQQFNEHKSMAYGADWLVREDGSTHWAASCSFYDKATFLWTTGL